MITINDKFREECGLIGIVNVPEAANLAYLGLYAQQHRGQEGAGVVAVNKDAHFSVHKGIGLVADVFQNFDFERLQGQNAIGHVRYTTAGGNRLANVQPLLSEVACGRVSVAHNGNLINADKLRSDLIKDGAIFGTSSDTEVFLHLLARAPSNTPLVESVISSLSKVKGAYSLLMQFSDCLMAIRDPNGFRPLAIGKLGEGYVIASETCAFDLLDAEYVRDVEPGELVLFENGAEPKSFYPFKRVEPSPCIFEYVYFARPDSYVFGSNVYEVRKRMGMELAKESHHEGADMVIPVPDSGVTAAIGYATEASIPLELGLIRNHYVGRTFIEPQQSIRSFGVRIKLNANTATLKDKVVVCIDDSIVRGTTSKKLVQMLRRAGAKEVHMRISAPPSTDPCYYGVDTPSKTELIASSMTPEEIAKYIEVDSLKYLSIDGLYRAVGSKSGSMCDACFTGAYPVGTPKQCGDTQEKLL